MSEEEIIETLQVLIGLEEFNKLSYKENKAIQGLLDLYNELKEKNASLEKEIKLMKSININDNYIRKDKIREKIKELENKKNCGNSIVFWEISSQIDLLKKLLEE